MVFGIIVFSSDSSSLQLNKGQLLKNQIKSGMWIVTALVPYFYKLLVLTIVLTVIWISIATKYSMNVIHVVSVHNTAAIDVRSDMIVNNSSDVFDIVLPSAQNYSEETKDDLVVHEITESKMIYKTSGSQKRNDDYHIMKNKTKSLSSKVKINNDLVVHKVTDSKVITKTDHSLKRNDDNHIANDKTKSLSNKMNTRTKIKQPISLPEENKRRTEMSKTTEKKPLKPLGSKLLEYIKNNFDVKKEPETIIKAIEYFQARDKVVNPLNYKFIHNGHKICTGEKQPWLLIMILSVASNTKERNVIRKTWGSVARGNKWRGTNKEFDSVKIMFIFGKSKNEHEDNILTREIDTYGDIVQADFVDSYNNLTRKVLMGVKWTTIFCPGVKYLMKVDDDTFVHIPNAARVLKRIRIPPNGAVFGNIVRGGVLRQGKWGLSYELYPFSNYPLYASGQTYTLSGNILHKIIWTGERLPYIFIEDAFVTGVVRTIIDADLTPLIGFPKVFMATAKPCSFHNMIRVAATNIDVTLMKNIWLSFSDKTVVDCYNCLSERC